MRIGSRIVRPEELDQWKLELTQISVYKGMRHNIELMKECAGECRRRGLSYVVHPVGYRILDTDSFGELMMMAEWTGECLILHDERAADRGRLSQGEAERFGESLAELASRTSISFENAEDTRDVHWFWQFFARSITLDMGHMEAAGLNSVDFVKSLNRDALGKVQYVHMHRNGDFRRGLTDHWPLTPVCRELSALEELLKLKGGVDVILEINETERTEDSLRLLRELRHRVLAND